MTAQRVSLPVFACVSLFDLALLEFSRKSILLLTDSPLPPPGGNMKEMHPPMGSTALVAWPYVSTSAQSPSIDILSHAYHCNLSNRYSGSRCSTSFESLVSSRIEFGRACDTKCQWRKSAVTAACWDLPSATINCNLDDDEDDGGKRILKRASDTIALQVLRFGTVVR